MKHIITRFLVLLFAIGSACIADAQIKTVSGKMIPAAAMDQFLKDQMDSLAMPGLSIAIINKGKIVYHRALGVTTMDLPGKVDEQSLFEAASLSKPVFAFFVMQMVEKGILDLDTPLYRYLPFPEIAQDERYKQITARMVLDHTTGFPNWRWFDPADPKLNIKRGTMYFKYAPGTFSYSGEAYFYLSRVVAHLTHCTLQNLDSLFQQEIAVPLGMQHAYFSWDPFIARHKVKGHRNGKVSDKKWPVAFPEQDSSWFGPAGGLHTDAISYAHFLIALMEGKGLIKKSMDEMLKVQVQIPKEHDWYKNDSITAWGLGISIKPTRYGIQYKHGGNNGDFQSGCMFYQAQQNGYVFFTNCDKGNVFDKKLGALLE